MSSAGDQALELPVWRHEQELIDALRDHQVVIVEGPTGSGKTTQLPRLLLRAGLTDKVIGVTQPRRIAAVSVAWRIAEELGVELGKEVGYTIRFEDVTDPETTRVKVMTDGILLQEARTDRTLSAYDVIMIDEAHERSLNIDFALGLLHQIITNRPDLRVIVSSATLSPETFQRFFADVAGEVPLVSIDARPYPVDIQYRPAESSFWKDLVWAAAQEVVRIHRSGEPGHMLVFHSGEAAIKQCIELIYREPGTKDLEVLPLYGRLRREEQELVFKEFDGRRKVICATNIAETSITVPGVRFVLDTGVAKVPRVQASSGIVALREEPISKASCDQRAGRAGRTGPGVCVRLYPEFSYRERPEFTDEEILRLDLTETALRLIDLGVKDIEDFPFPTPPPLKRVQAGIENLLAMRAIDADRNLTPVGERMVPFPLAPPLARMIVEAAERYPDVVDEVLIVGAFMSARSPYLFPAGEEKQARAAQDALASPMGDAVTDVTTFTAYQDARDKRTFCRRYYLDAHIMGFIAKAHDQLADIARWQGIEVKGGGSPADLIRAFAAAFAQNVMMAHGRQYEGPGQDAIHLHPSSSLYSDPPRFVVAGDLIISGRTYAHRVSRLEAAWVREINPQAADRWNIRLKSKKKREAVPPEELPAVLRLGERDPVECAVRARRGAPRVEIRLEDVPRLVAQLPVRLPNKEARWEAKLVDEQSTGKKGKPTSWGAGTPLGALLELLPELPLPAPGEVPVSDLPEGALLDLERNLHTIERYLDRVLLPMKPTRSRRPGWAMLAANGGGAYWFEVIPNYPDAVDSTVYALGDLQDRLPPGDPFAEQVGERLVDANARQETLRRIFEAHKRRPKG